MGNSYLTNPVVFVLNVVFGLYVLAVMLRFLLQWFRGDFYNPLSQFLVKVTNPPLKPLRRVIPGVGGVDAASIVLMMAIVMVWKAITALIIGSHLGVAILLFVSINELVQLLLNVFLFAILIQVILSWVNPGAYNPAISVIYTITEPVLRPARRWVPPIGGLDLSPLVAMVVIQVIKMLLEKPILTTGIYLQQLIG